MPAQLLTVSDIGSLVAPLSSPAFTDAPTAPTAATGDNTEQLATTAFVQQELLAGGSTARALVVSVRNQSGATMTAGTVVYINGSTGNLPTIAKAIATSDATSAQTLGLVQTSIANNGTGLVVVRGILGSLNTSGLTEGQQLYLSPTTAGTYTTTKQHAPNHLVYIGIVTRAHPTQGSIEVAVQNGFEMDELHNVSAQSPANGDTLRWNAATSLWEKSASINNLVSDLSAETARATAAEALARPLDPRLSKTWAKLFSITQGSVAQLKILAWSDSMNGIGSESTMTIFGRALAQSYGDLGAGVSPTIDFTGAASAGDSSASGSAANYTRWPISLPPSLTGAGGTITWGRGGSTAYCDTLKIYYIKESGAGNFKVQSSTDGSIWADEAGYTNVAAANATMQLGIITISKTLASYMVRVVGISGTVYFAPARFVASSVAGVEIISMAIGGLGLNMANLAPASVWGAYVADISPDLASFEMKESAATLVTTLPAWWANMSANAINTDWIFFGSTPLQTNDADQVAQNLIIANHCTTYRKYFFDAYNLFGASWTTANGYGFMSDSTHRSNLGNAYLASQLCAIGAFESANAVTPYGARTTREIISSDSIGLAYVSGLKKGATLLAKLQVRAGSSNQDAEILFNRSGFFTGPSGGTVEVNPDGVGNSGQGYIKAPAIIGLGTAGDTYLARLGVSGLTINTTNTNSRGTPGYLYAKFWAFEGGNAAAPSFTFQDAQNRGFYPVTNGIGLSVGGTQVGQWTAGRWTWGTSGPVDTWGTGTPEGSVTAPVGSTYRRSDGTAGTCFYVKESGTGNTGWVAK